MEIFKLVGNIFVDNEKANKGIDETDSKGQKLGKTFQKMGKGIVNFGKIAAVGAGAVGAGMVALASKTGEAADRLLDLNSITGMSTDEIQKWERVATVAGVSADAMTNVSQKLTKQMDILSTGTGKASEASEALGLSYEKLSGMNADERMNAVVKALQDVADPTERAKLGTDLLGGSWKDLAPILDVGAEKLQEVKDNANIISNEDLNKANEFRIKMDQMKERVTVFGQELAIKFIPILNNMLDWFDKNMPMIEHITKKTFDFMEKGFKILSDFIVKKFIPTLQAIWEWVEPQIPLIEEFFTIAFENMARVIGVVWEFVKDNLLPILVNMFNWVRDNMPGMQLFFETAFNAIWSVIENVWSLLEITLFPVLKLLFEWVGNNLPVFQGIFEAVFGAINIIIGVTAGVIEGIITTIKDMVDAIKDAIEWLTQLNSMQGQGTPQGLAADSGMIQNEAMGGPVYANRAYKVGENGAEMFIPSQDGTIVSNNKMNAMMGGTSTLQIIVKDNTLLGESDEVADKLGEVVVTRLREVGVF